MHGAVRPGTPRREITEMRHDGREPDQLRPLSMQVDFTENPLASVLCAMGRTKVLCTVCEELSVPRFLKGTGRGWVTAEYSMLPGSTDRRSEREAARGKQGGRTLEIQRLVGRSLRAVVDLDRIGERTLWIDCDVLQADGGTRTASITGAYVAARLAVQKLMDAGKIAENPLKDSIAAVSVGIVDGIALLDLPYTEDRDAEVDANIVMTGGGQFVEVQSSGEESTFSPAQFSELLALATGGLGELARLQAEFLARQLLASPNP
jgi:ribonuclease PH